MTAVVANMVVRNEAEGYLRRVLDRLQNQVDLICVTDDASDDDTAEIADSYEKVVLNRMSEPTFRVHEGRLRQASWEHLEKHLPDQDALILAIDADEELYESTYTLRDLVELRNFNIFSVHFFHMWNETQYRTDGGWRPHPSTRVFRYAPGGQFADRQLACGSEPSYVANSMRDRQWIMNNYMMRSGLFMKHLSYIKDEDKQRKYERYAELDGGAFHAGAHIQSIIDPPELVTLETWSYG